MGFHKIATASNDDVLGCVLALGGRHGTDKGSEPGKELVSALDSASLLIWMDRRHSHEAVLEAMALAVEVRARIGKRQRSLDKSSERHAKLKIAVYVARRLSVKWRESDYQAALPAEDTRT